jgi:hypothetical protein
VLNSAAMSLVITPPGTAAPLVIANTILFDASVGVPYASPLAAAHLRSHGMSLRDRHCRPA